MGKKSRSKNLTGNEIAGAQKNKVNLAMTPRVRYVGLAAGIAVITFILYLPALSNEFVHWDDPTYIINNYPIQAMDSNFFIWIWGFHASNWHPLTWVSHALDYAFWGLKPSGHHLSSIVLHGINTFLVFIAVMQLMLARYRSRHIPEPERAGTRQRALLAAGITALLFGIHPLHVESVAWVSERKDVLSTFFVLLSLISYMKYCTLENTRKHPLLYISSLFMFVLALLSKPMAVTLPFMLILFDIYPYERLTGKADKKVVIRVLIEKIPFLALAFGAAIVTFIAQRSGGAVQTFGDSPLTNRTVVAVKAIVLYLVKMLVPVGLSPYYPYPKDISFLSAEFIGALILVIVISGVCIYAWKRGWKVPLLAWVFYLGTLLPVLGIIRIGTHEIAERYTYIPSIGIFLLCGLGESALVNKVTKGPTHRRGRLAALFVPLLAVFCVFSWLTYKQITVWRNSVTLWSAVIERFPDALKAYYSRAEYYILTGKFPEALKDLEKAIQLSPSSAGAYYYRGLVYLNKGEFQKSIDDFSRAIQFDPANSIAYFHRAEAHFKLEKYREAIDDNTQFLGSGSSSGVPEAHYNRAQAYIKIGSYEKAIGDLTAFLNSSQGADSSRKYKAYLERAAAYMKRDEYQQALQDCTRALEVNPQDLRAYHLRAVIYYSQGNLQEALNTYSEIIARNARDYDAFGKRATVYLKMARYDDAIRDFQLAARLGDVKSQDILKRMGKTW